MLKKILFLITLTFFVSFAAYTSILFPLPADIYQIVSTIALVLFSLPSFYFLSKSIGLRKGVIAISLLFLFALSFEYFAIKTGFPYGHFTYSDRIGFLLFDTVPLFVSFAWTPLIIGSLFLAKMFQRNLVMILLLSTILLVLADFILDPGAVALTYWSYSGIFFLYSVPLSNFLGWILSGFMGSALLTLFTRDKQEAPSPWILLSLYIMLVYWTTITITFQLWISVLIGIPFIFFLLYLFLENSTKAKKSAL